MRSWSVIAVAFALACSEAGSRSRAKTSFALGDEIDAGACAETIDCPFGFSCDEGRCVVLSPDRDGDGYGDLIDCDDARV